MIILIVRVFPEREPNRNESECERLCGVPSNVKRVGFKGTPRIHASMLTIDVQKSTVLQRKSIGPKIAEKDWLTGSATHRFLFRTSPRIGWAVAGWSRCAQSCRVVSFAGSLWLFAHISESSWLLCSTSLENSTHQILLIRGHTDYDQMVRVS